MAGQIYTGISTPSLGANLGSALGQGLSSGIQNVLNLRMKKLEQQEIAKALEAAGIPSAQAQAFSLLDPSVQPHYLKSIATAKAYSPEASKLLKQYNINPALAEFGPDVLATAVKNNLKSITLEDVQQLFPGISHQEALAYRNSPTLIQSAIYKNYSQAIPEQEQIPGETAVPTNGATGLEQLQLLGQPGMQPGMEQIVPHIGAGLQNIQQQLPVQTAPSAPQKMEQPIQVTPNEPKVEPRTYAQRAQEARIKALKQKQKERGEEQYRETYKIFKPQLDEIQNSAKASEKNINTYNEVLSLLDTGKIRSGAMYQALSKIGMQDFLSNPETQLAKKLLARLNQNAAAAFKTGRLTNLGLSLHKESLGQLWNTEEGLRNIMKDSILMDEGNIVLDKARRKVLDDAQKNGVFPYDVLDLINDEAKPKIDDLAEQAVTNIRQSNTAQVPSVTPEVPLNPNAEPTQAQTGLMENPLIRGAARTGARALESLAGLGGDVLGGTLGLANYASGGAIPNYQTIQNALEERGIPHLPTSRQLREVVTKGLTGEKLEPQGKVEEFVDDVVSDIATLALPVKGKVPFKTAAARALGGNFASWATKELGGGPLAQAGAKLGVMTLASLSGGKKALNNNMKESYATAEKIASGVKEDAKGLSSKVNTLLKQASKGASTPEKEIAKNFLLDVDQKIGAGTKIALDEVTQLKRDINKILYSPKTAKETSHLLKPITTEFDSLIKQYAQKSPEFAENFYKAEDIWRGLKTQSKATEFLNKHVNLEKLTVAKAVLGLGGGALLGVPKAAAAAVGALGLRQGSRAFDLITKSSEVRKYYANTLKAALAQNAPAALREAKKLDAVAKKKI